MTTPLKTSFVGKFESPEKKVKVKALNYTKAAKELKNSKMNRRVK